MRYSQFYNTARCSPSRASLLTGLHPHQTGIGILTYDTGPEGYPGDLSKNCVTIAEVLKRKNYRCYLSGKWHIAKNLTTPTGAWPLQRGFDEFFGTIIGAGSFYNPNTLTRGNDNVEHEAEQDPEFFYTDAISDQAADYVRAHARSIPKTPFFHYVAYTAPHWPLHAHEEDIAKYKGRFDAGWDRLREERLARLVKDGIIHPAWRLTDRDPTQPPWTEAEHREWLLRCMEVYAAQIDRMDQGIGRIIAGARGDRPVREHPDHLPVRQRRLRGGHPGGRHSEGAGRRADDRQGDDPHRRARALRQRPEHHARRRGHLPELRDRLGQSLEHALPALQALDPRRRHRHAADRALAARHRRGGGLRHHPGQLPDIMATILDVTGAAYPREHDGHAIPPCEGESLVPSFTADDTERGPLFWEHEGNAAVRVGKWKLVRNYPGPWELYDLEADRTEMHDLAAQHPERVREMSAQYAAWAERCGVIPREKILELMKAQAGKAFWEDKAE